MSRADSAYSAFASVDGAAIAAANRLSIGRQVEELLRIRREAGEAASRLIELLDLEDGDPDLEDTGDEDEGNADAEPSLGWTLTTRQEGKNWTGHDWAVDVEAEHDGREPDVDDEDGGDTEPNGDEQDEDHRRYPAVRPSPRRTYPHSINGGGIVVVGEVSS